MWERRVGSSVIPSQERRPASMPLFSPSEPTNLPSAQFHRKGQGSDTEGQLAPGQAALRAPRAGERNQKPYREAAEAPPSLAPSRNC